MKTTTKTGVSTNVKVGIGVALLLGAGIAAFAIIPTLQSTTCGNLGQKACSTTGNVGYGYGYGYSYACVPPYVKNSVGICSTCPTGKTYDGKGGCVTPINVTPAVLSVSLGAASIPSLNLVGEQTSVGLGSAALSTSTSGGDVTVKAFVLRIGSTESMNKYFKKLWITYSGSNVAIPATVSMSTYLATITPAQPLVMHKGTQLVVSVRGDITSNPGNNQLSFNAVLSNSTSTYVPSTPLPISFFTVKTTPATLSSSINPAVANMNVAKESSNKVIGSMLLSASASEDVNLSKITITDADGRDGLGKALSNIRLVSGGKVYSTVASNPSTTSKIPLTLNLSSFFTVPASKSVQMDIVADIKSTGTLNGNSDAISVTGITGVGSKTAATISSKNVPTILQRYTVEAPSRFSLVPTKYIDKTGRTISISTLTPPTILLGPGATTAYVYYSVNVVSGPIPSLTLKDLSGNIYQPNTLVTLGYGITAELQASLGRIKLTTNASHSAPATPTVILMGNTSSSNNALPIGLSVK